jgi:hypothetical protein
MRTFINGIFSFIGSESLTDEEFDALPEGLTQTYSRELYDAMRGILIGRESISTQGKKLKAYFGIKGLDVWNEVARPPASQILVGKAL